MATTIDLEATRRPGVGKGAARQARRAGQVPGVVYGGSQDPVAININQPALLKRLKGGHFLTTLINLSVDGKSETVICRGVQRDVVKDLPIHVDFLRLSQNSRIRLLIPVEFINDEESPGLRKGGVLTVVRNEVELLVRADNIPTHVEADLTGIDLSDVIRISNIAMPEGARPTITDRDFMIANISAPSALGAADEDADEIDGDVEVEGDGEDENEESVE